MNLYFPGAGLPLFQNFWFVFVEVAAEFLETQKDDHIMDLEGAKVRFESQNYHIYLLVVESSVLHSGGYEKIAFTRRFCKIAHEKTQPSQTPGFHTSPLLPLEYQSIL